MEAFCECEYSMGRTELWASQ